MLNQTSPISLVTVHELKKRIAFLEEENQRLRDCAATVPSDWPEFLPALGLTSSEAKVLRLLSANAGRHLSRRAIIAAAWRQQNPPGDSIVSVMVSHINKKLKPHGIRISHRVGFGYALSVEYRDRLDAIGGRGA